MGETLPLRDLTGWRRRKGGRPRLRAVANWLRRLAARIYPEPSYTLVITKGDPPEETTFVDCREWRGS